MLIGASLMFIVASLPPSAWTPLSGRKLPPSPPVLPQEVGAAPLAPAVVITIVSTVAGMGMAISDGRGSDLEMPRALKARLALTFSVPVVETLPMYTGCPAVTPVHVPLKVEESWLSGAMTRFNVVPGSPTAVRSIGGSIVAIGEAFTVLDP